ncbi:MAG: Dabb family protein [Ginsengibacter sp.]
MITHTVFFKTKFPEASEEEKNFFTRVGKLAGIPGVKSFQWVKQVSKKNSYDYGLIMQFDDQELYDDYNAHPDHTTFIEQCWLPAVTDFIEIDHKSF